MRISFRKFLLLAPASVVAFCLGIVAFNVFINPYGIWPDLTQGRLSKKTARINSVRMVKAYDLLRGCPDHIITGMSSVVWGVDPVRYPVADKRLYNGGIVGSSAVEQYAYVKSYLDQCPSISKLYIDVNYESFRNSRIPPSDFSFDRLSRRFPTLDDFLFTTFSRSAIVASLDTIKNYRTRRVERMKFDRGDGYHRIPEREHAVYENNFVRRRAGVFQRNNRRLDQMQIEFFREMVSLAKSRNVEVEVYFAPIHYWLHYMRRHDAPVGSATTERLHAELKRRVAEIHEFWDFNLYNRISAAPVDSIDWFIDIIHYRPATGAAVLATINGKRPADWPANMGVKVTKANIEQHLQEFKAGLDRWEIDFPDEARSIREVFEAKPVRG